MTCLFKAFPPFLRRDGSLARQIPNCRGLSHQCKLAKFFKRRGGSRGRIHFEASRQLVIKKSPGFTSKRSVDKSFMRHSIIIRRRAAALNGAVQSFFRRLFSERDSQRFGQTPGVPENEILRARATPIISLRQRHEVVVSSTITAIYSLRWLT